MEDIKVKYKQKMIGCIEKYVSERPPPPFPNTSPTQQTRQKKTPSPNPLRSPSQPRTPRQIPRQTRPAINQPQIKPRRGKEVPRSLWIHDGEIGIQDPAPAARDGVGAAVAEVGRPFLRHERFGAREGRGRGEREHVDSLDVFGVQAEVGCVGMGLLALGREIRGKGGRRRY